jgi:hypothetical protein
VLSLLEMKSDRSQCRWPLTVAPPHFFCGEPVTKPPYCDRCRKEHKPFTGIGKDWQALAGMMAATERTVIPVNGPNTRDSTGLTHRTGRREHENTQPLDEVLRQAETHFDEPGGLMRRT